MVKPPSPQMATQGDHHHERDTRGAQPLEGERAIRSMRVETGNRGRECLGNLMVVYDDDVEALIPGYRDLIERGDSAVRGDQHLGALRDGSNRFHVEPVALRPAVGDVIVHLAAHAA